jgi:zinc transporter, ZIP family
MEAGAASDRSPLPGRAPAWLLGLLPLALIAAAVGIFAMLGGPGLGERTGPPVEELAVERTVLRPGEIELIVRNDGPDPVEIAQVAVADAYVAFSASDGLRLERLGTTTIEIPYPWIEGEAYELFFLTSTGAKIAHEIPVAAETPATDVGFFGLMALLGLYVGVIPVSIGMLWLPFVRRVGGVWLGALIAFTVGLLVFLGIDAALEGLEIADSAPSVLGGPVLLFVGALGAYLALSAVDTYLARRRERISAAADGEREEPKLGRRGAAPATAGAYLSLLVAIGIGLHNLGEGLAIGSAYAAGALALGTFLVVGFALHNTTEGLAIVAPLSRERPSLARLAVLGLIAGAPVIVGAWIGAAAFDPSLATLLFGIGVGAIVQVVYQLAPVMRDDSGRTLHPIAVAAMLAGIAALYVTGLLVTV